MLHGRPDGITRVKDYKKVDSSVLPEYVMSALFDGDLPSLEQHLGITQNELTTYLSKGRLPLNLDLTKVISAVNAAQESKQ